MSGLLAGTKRRRANEAPGESEDGSPCHEAVDVRKRRAFLHTMGQQLREFGTEGVSPQDQSRNAFSSPGGRPVSSGPHPSIQPDAAPGGNITESNTVSGEYDQLPAGAAQSASRWLWRAEEVRSEIHGDSVPPLQFEDLLDWSQSYFDHWHPSFPFLHAPAILNLFRDVARAGVMVSTSSAPKLLNNVILRSIMSISALDRRQLTHNLAPLPPSIIFHSFDEAINSVQPVLTEESSILSLQALVSVQLLLVSMHRYNAASRLQGIAAHLAFQLDLHKCPMRTSLHTDKDAELRKRLFWSIFCIDRYVSVRLGNPSVISTDDIDTCYPRHERHVRSDISDVDHDDRLDLVDFLAQHATIRGSIMKLRNRTSDSHITQDDRQALKVETEHAKWWTNVDEYFSDDQNTQTITKPHQVTLIVLRFETILALHRSILGNPKHDTVFDAALQRCVTASRSIINTLHKALKGFGAFDGSPGQNGYERTPLLWPSFTWTLWMSTFVVFFAATEGQLSHKIAFGLADRSIEVLQHIALRGTSWPDSCIVAIKNLTARLRRSHEKDTGAARRGNLGVGHVRVSETPKRTQWSPSYQHPQILPSSRGQTQTIQHTASATTAPTSSLEQAHFHVASIDSIAINPRDIGSQNANAQNHQIPAGYQFSGSGDFLGIAQQSSDIPRGNEHITQLFSSEDLTWWTGNNFEMEGVL